MEYEKLLGPLIQALIALGFGIFLWRKNTNDAKRKIVLELFKEFNATEMIEARIACNKVLEKIIEKPYYEAEYDYKHYFQVMSFCASVSNMLRSDFIDNDFAFKLIGYQLSSFSDAAEKAIKSYCSVLSDATSSGIKTELSEKAFNNIDPIMIDVAVLNEKMSKSKFGYKADNDYIIIKEKYRKAFPL